MEDKISIDTNEENEDAKDNDVMKDIIDTEVRKVTLFKLEKEMLENITTKVKVYYTYQLAGD